VSSDRVGSGTVQSERPDDHRDDQTRRWRPLVEM
jgi:hypothetical protein